MEVRVTDSRGSKEGPCLHVAILSLCDKIADKLHLARLI